ncbi:MAG: hypothetical protein CMP25_01895 [Rickettsiales bacterium]|nr:hypothetical protein [Rickettsiales bacterium]
MNNESAVEVNKEKKSEENQGFLLKIDSIRKRTHSFSLMLKEKDIIVALNNQFYLAGEKLLVEELAELRKKNQRTILTIKRDDFFFDVFVRNSLGCKFSTLSSEETKNIQTQFSTKKISDIEELKEFNVFRDLKNNFECIEDTFSVVAGLFPPAWLAYEQKWWILSFFSIFSLLLLSINSWIFAIGWIIVSIYCYKAQKNLILGFALLSGKALSMKIVATNIHEAHKIIRCFYPKSKFKYSRLDDPHEIEDEKNFSNDKKNISETKNALV